MASDLPLAPQRIGTDPLLWNIRRKIQNPPTSDPQLRPTCRFWRVFPLYGPSGQKGTANLFSVLLFGFREWWKCIIHRQSKSLFQHSTGKQCNGDAACGWKSLMAQKAETYPSVGQPTPETLHSVVSCWMAQSASFDWPHGIRHWVRITDSDHGPEFRMCTGSQPLWTLPWRMKLITSLQKTDLGEGICPESRIKRSLGNRNPPTSPNKSSEQKFPNVTVTFFPCCPE